MFGLTSTAPPHPVTTVDAAFVNAHLDQQPPPTVDKSLEHLSDLEVAKASKAAADRAARDEVVNRSAAPPRRVASHIPSQPKFDREYCDVHFGMRWLQAWNATVQTMCSPHQYSTPPLHHTVVRCRSVLALTAAAAFAHTH